MTSRVKKAGYSTVAGLGLFAGVAGIAAAATGGSSTSSPPAATTAATENATDVPEANDIPDTNESDAANEAPAYTGSVTAPEQNGASEADESTALEALATVTPDQASAAATAAVPGTVNKVELDNENGSVVYSVEIQTTSGTVDVKVDAGNATVLAQEADDDGGETGQGDHENRQDENGGQDESGEAANG